MWVYAHHSKFYDWLPVPEGTPVTQEDLKTNRARLGHDGRYLMKVPVDRASTTSVCYNEETIIGKIIHAYTDHQKCGKILTRHEAVAALLQEHTLPGHSHGRWLKKFDIHDDGPDEALFDRLIAPHLDADHGRAPGKNIEPEDVPELKAAYMTPVSDKGHAHDHVEHLTKHFKIKKESAK